MEVSVLIADKAGACFGVSRALEMVREAAASHESRVCTLGPLIHNPKVVSELEAAGVATVESPDQAAGETLVLRTHGVTPAVERQANDQCTEVIDATCPFVKRAHKAAEKLMAEGYQVVVVGEEGHPEVMGIVGHAPGALVATDPSQLEGHDLGRKVGVVVQTTMTVDRLRAVVDYLAGRVAELRLVNTICEATSQRQAAAADLAGQVDLVLVIGGRNSANTTRLAEICAEKCVRTHHIEDADELDPAWFAGVHTVGITAGASTPQDQIAAVQDRIASLR